MTHQQLDGGPEPVQDPLEEPSPGAAPSPQAERVVNNRDTMRHSLLHRGDRIKNRWSVIERFADGGFGQIYSALDLNELNDADTPPVAIKVESAAAPMRTLHIEVDCLRALTRPSPYLLDLYDSGRVLGQYDYAVMALGGRNLRELKKATPADRFSAATTVRVALQLLRAIAHVHSCGWIHRDMKPSNFCQSPYNPQQLCIIDFGLARRYEDRHGRHVAQRESRGFHGTARYASPNTHKKLDLSRRDDVWPILFIYSEHIQGQLPWRSISDKTVIGRMKESMEPETLLPHDCARWLHQQLLAMHFADAPPYSQICARFDCALALMGVTEDTPYDWQTDKL